MKSAIRWCFAHSYITAIGLFVLLHVAILLFSGLDRPIFGDEGHFIATINQFSQNTSLETLRSYNEMSTPLPFIFYAFWSNLFGSDITMLRLFSLLIGFITALCFFQLCKSVISNPVHVLLAYLIFIIQPYLIGFTLYVYTDMLAILGLLIAFYGVVKQRWWLVLIGLVFALLCRQYAIYFIIGLLCYYGFDLFILRRTHARPFFWITFCSLIPLLLLFRYWQGMAPDNAIRELYLQNGTSFSLATCILYVACIPIYLFPALLLKAKTIFTLSWAWAAAVLLSLLYFLAPVRASEAAVAVNIETVGIFHKFVHHLFKRQYLEDDLFYLCFILGTVVLVRLGYELWTRWQKRKNDIVTFFVLLPFTFLIVMPFSYLRWEKYFMLLLPFLLIGLFLIERKKEVIEIKAPL